MTVPVVDLGHGRLDVRCPSWGGSFELTWPATLTGRTFRLILNGVAVDAPVADGFGHYTQAAATLVTDALTAAGI